ncbi:MAG: hypothetical protein JXD18_05700 [Anaerolineae bacterium]|nr:hypothetical protein [Anaerolineae bacterium]
MKRIGVVLGVLAALIVVGAGITSGVVESQPPLQSGGDEYCVSCHTDADALVALAVEPETEELSEGEG